MPDTTTPQLDALLEHRSWVRDLARRLVRDAAAAEDLAQEAWVRVMRSPPDPDRDPRPWLRRVLKNLASNRWRGESRRAVRESAWRERRIQRTPAELVEEADQHQRLVRRVLDLDEPFKTTLVLRFYEGLSPREIAKRLGIAEGTVHSRVARAVERLRDQLDDEAGGDRKRWIAALLPLARLDLGAPAAAATAMSLTGVLLMITKSKVAVLTVLALLAVAAGGWWLAADSDDGVSPSESLADRDIAARPILHGRARAPSIDEDAPLSAEPVPNLEATSFLAGRVVDARGDPVADAEVFVLPEGVVGVEDSDVVGERLSLVRSNIEGEFRVEPAPEEGQLVAFSEGLLPAGVRVADVAGGEPVVLTLSDPRTITLRVEDPEGHWPAQCHARIQTDYDHTWERTADPTRLAHLTLVDLAPEPRAPEQVVRVPTLAPVHIQVHPPRGWAVVPRRIDLPMDADRADFRLLRSGELHLRLVDDTTGTTPPETSRATLTIVDLADLSLAAIYSSRPNEFHVTRRLSPGKYRADVEVDGYRPASRAFEVRSPGERSEFLLRLEPRVEAARGRLLLRIVDPDPAADAVPLPVRSGLGDRFVAFVRAAGETEWQATSAVVLPDGRVELRPSILETLQSGFPRGTYDVYVAGRTTATAAFVAGVRVFGGQENETPVTLRAGAFFRVTDVVPPGETLANLEVRARGLGQLPMINFRRDGHWTITTAAGVESLLSLPLEPYVLGPFPAEEIEIVLTTADGEERTMLLRGGKSDR